MNATGAAVIQYDVKQAVGAVLAQYTDATAIVFRCKVGQNDSVATRKIELLRMHGASSL
jgi:hypothetical protein